MQTAKYGYIQVSKTDTRVELTTYWENMGKTYEKPDDKHKYGLLMAAGSNQL
jgi:hypothetical protein